MNRPYVKEEVRNRVIKALQRGFTYAEIADAFGIGVATVNRIWRRFRETGSASLLPRGGGTRPAISENEQKTFEKFVADRPLATYDDLATEWSKKAGKKISRSAIVRHVLRLGFTRKNLTKVTSKKSTKKNKAKRAEYKFRIKPNDLRLLVFLDESGFQSNQTPN